MNIPRLSLAGYLIGLVCLAVGIMRFNPDTDTFKFVFSIGTGLLICIVTYILQRLRLIDEKIQGVQTQADALGSKLFGLENETIEELARRNR